MLRKLLKFHIYVFFIFSGFCSQLQVADDLFQINFDFNRLQSFYKSNSSDWPWITWFNCEHWWNGNNAYHIPINAKLKQYKSKLNLWLQFNSFVANVNEQQIELIILLWLYICVFDSNHDMVQRNIQTKLNNCQFWLESGISY